KGLSMGTQVTASGVSVQLCDDDGAPIGSPAFSTFVRILGQPQKDVFNRTGGPSSEEKDFPGSTDWLTLVAIADSHDNIDALVAASNLPDADAQASGSSRRVKVMMDLPGFHNTFVNRVTIATGPVIQAHPPKMNVVFIKVLGPGAQMNPSHPLWPEFRAQGPF